MVTAPLPRRLLAEFLGSAFLATIVIGSAIAAARLSPTDTGLALLENALATAAGLFAIILMFGPISGGHFNPVVSLVDAHFGGLAWRDAAAYIPAQIAGCISGAVLANGMFALDAISISQTHRASGAHMLAEAVATIGLLLVIFSLARTGRGASAPAAVGAYIGAAYRQRPSVPASAGESKPSGAQQSSSPFHSPAHSLIAMAQMTSAAIGSRIDQPAPAASSAKSAVAACAAQSRFWIPSPAVASEPSCLARRSLARPSSGISTIAEIVTMTPSALACTSLPCRRRSSDS